MEKDTVYLLRECSAGCKMASDNLSATLAKVNDEGLKKVLQEYYGRHVSLANDCARLLTENGEEDKDAPFMAKAMGEMKTEMKFAFSDKPSIAAKLMMDGCNMGIKTVGGYLNKYPAASKESKDLANDIIQAEKCFVNDLIKYL